MRISPFPPQNISDFDDHFSQKTLARAQELVREETVEILECSGSNITARVQGSEFHPYDVLINFGGHYHCTCPSEVQPCKHVAAVLIQATKSDSNGFDLNAHLQNLELAQAKTLLIDLASLPEVRPVLLKRVLVKTSSIPKGAIKALKTILKRSQNIEHEGDIGEAAFAELSTLPAFERSDEAWQIYELVRGYEINYAYYDPEDESGDAYWEDRQSDWEGRALQHWGTAEAELDRGEAALRTIIQKIDINSAMWNPAIEIAKRVPTGAEMLEEWLERVDGRSVRYLDTFKREFVKTFKTADEYEQHLRDHLESPNNYVELMYFLQQQNRQKDALEIAAAGVRDEISRLKRGRGDITVYQRGEHWSGTQTASVNEMRVMLALLQEHQPSFEWESAFFRIRS
jgi:SWIM zinc finger